jgi:formylmethanofuran dehydrogenase subunit B
MTAQAKAPAQPPAIIDHATCLGCGCLCDDIAVTVGAGRIVEARHACEQGGAWFAVDEQPLSHAPALIEGRAVAIDEALDRAAQILGSSRAPIFMGLTSSSLEAQGAAFALADRIGAVVCLDHAVDAERRIQAYQRVGRVGATLGEVKNRADVVVFWGVDPITTHPRHWERYSVEPAGRFVPQGRAGRTVLVADAELTATAERADHFLRITRDDSFVALWMLRGLVREVDLPAVDHWHAPESLSAWAAIMKGARYGAFFFGSSLGAAPGGAAAVEAAFRLVRDLNAHTRFVALPLGAPGNAAGAEAVLTWQTGYPLGVNFRLGYPRALPGEADAAELLARGEADAALLIDGKVPEGWPREALDGLARVPQIQIGPGATATGQKATVALATSRTGIHSGGTVIRVDGVSLPLRPSLTSPLPSERELLCMLAARVGAGASRRGSPAA